MLMRMLENVKFVNLVMEKEKRATIPLKPVTISRPFEKWAIDVIGEINPNSSKPHKYILTAIDYFT